MDLTLLSTQAVDQTSWTFTTTVVISGIVIVVAMLVLLILLFSVYGKIMSKSGKKSSKSEVAEVVAAPVVAPAPASDAPVAQNGITGEIVAAIGAAIYAIEGESAQICSITPAVATVGAPAPARKTSPLTSRNPWAQAAIADNTRPF